MYLMQEHDLKFHRMRAVSAVSSIERIEKIMTRLLIAGFILLTRIGIGKFLFFKTTDSNFTLADPKSVSGLVWLAYLVILILHTRRLQTGRDLRGGCGTFIFVY